MIFTPSKLRLAKQKNTIYGCTKRPVTISNFRFSNQTWVRTLQSIQKPQIRTEVNLNWVKTEYQLKAELFWADLSWAELVIIIIDGLSRLLLYITNNLSIVNLYLTSSAQLRSAQKSSALIEYLTKLSSDSYLIRLVQQTQLSTD